MGVNALKKSLTVVLPMHNCERQLRSSVLEILEFCQSTNVMINVVVVDDGSTDETYETACEMSRVYPQVKVLRRPDRQGFNALLDMIGQRLSTDQVVVHDGVTPISICQLKTLLQASPEQQSGSQAPTIRETASVKSAGSRRFASVRALHQSMEQAHRGVTGFRWVQLEKALIPRRRVVASQPLPVVFSGPQTVVSSGIAPML